MISLPSITQSEAITFYDMMSLGDFIQCEVMIFSNTVSHGDRHSMNNNTFFITQYNLVI